MDVGSVIKDQYKVIEHIGRGGMADVWSARDMRLRRLVAIKTIAKGLSADVDPVALFEKEAQTIAAMEHPHILPIYDFGEFEGSLYIVMRFVTGGSLENMLRAGPMDVQDVLKMGDAIARALDYAHENNIIHLDLKPPNILLGTQQTPYLADFGLATVLDVEGRARNPGSGTLLYMAPEQIVAEVIDHRADIYAFSIMLFHMLTGRLPFDGTAPLALMQLQTGRTIPDITNFVHSLPQGVNDLLRYGTAQNLVDRPRTIGELMENFHALISPVSTLEFGVMTMGLDELGPGISLRTQQFVDEGQLEILEAVDVYSRARQQWAGGQGRFTLGMSPFLMASGYYQDAIRYDLQIDESGYEMLLRGALEYDTDIDYWWSKLDDNSRREVCLHTLRSLNIPARIRALDRLETLRDDSINPAIPRLIGQALEIERNEEVQIAALRVLRTRMRMMPPRMNVKAKDESSLWQQSMTRLGVQILATADWPESVYTPEIDTLIAKKALDPESPRVAEYAARTIGQIRSLAAIQHIADAQLDGERGALQALAFIRDEAPALPHVVSRQGRLYAWITNTVRRLTDRPLEGILRFVLVLLGGWIGMGELVYTTYRSQALFAPQRWGNTLAIGLVFGLFLAFTVLLADEFSRRLERFWQGWLRLLLFGALGYLMGTITWGAFTWMFFNYTPSWDIMRLTGAGLAMGLVLAALLQLRGLPAVIFTTLSAYLPMYALFRNYYFGDYTSVTPAIPLGLVWGGVIGWLVRRRVAEASYGANSAARPAGTGWRGKPHAVMDIPQWPEWARILLAGAGGVLFGAVAWVFIVRTYESFPLGGSSLTWDGVMVLFVVSMLIGILMSYATKRGPRIAFFLMGIAVLLTMEFVAGRYFYGTPFQALNRLGWNAPLYHTTAFAPTPDVPIIYFDRPKITNNNNMMLATALPMVLSFALGAYALMLWRDTWHYVGAPRASYERGGWLTGVLIYSLITTAFIGIFALFSLHVDLRWGLAWSLWGFTTWLCLVAAWRWARWGAWGAVLSVGLLMVGGFAADLFESNLAARTGLTPPLEQVLRVVLHPGPQTTLLEIISTAPVLWMVWGFGMLLALRSAGQRKIWGYVVSVGLALIFALALLIAQMPDSAEAVAAAPTLSIQVNFFWLLWALALVATLSGVLYRQLWSGIALVGLIVGWFVIVLFGGIAGSYAVLAATHAALVLYALRPEWAKMEPNRFHWPWVSGEPTDGTLRLAAVPLSAASVPTAKSSREGVQPSGPTLLRETPMLTTQPVTPTRLQGISEVSNVVPNINTMSVMPVLTDIVVDEEAAEADARANLNTEPLNMNTEATPPITPDLHTALDPNSNLSGSKPAREFPRLRLGQTGPLTQPKPPLVPRIRLDTAALDRSRMAETRPPVVVPPDKGRDETPTVEASDVQIPHTEAGPMTVKPPLGEDTPTVETFDLHNAQTQAVPPDLKPVNPPADDAGPTPRIKIGTGKLPPLPDDAPPSDSGPTMAKIKLGDSSSSESGPTMPKIKLGGGKSAHPSLPGQPSTTGGLTVPGIKINLSSLGPSKLPPAPTGLPKIKLDGGSSTPPAPPPTMPVPPDLKASLQKPSDDIEDADFEELPPDEE